VTSLRILRLAEVLAATGLGRTSLYDSVRAGDFPKPVQLTKAAVGWRSDEVEAWIRSRPHVGVSAGVSEDAHAA
jgi:prophage regulatory protein